AHVHNTTGLALLLRTLQDHRARCSTYNSHLQEDNRSDVSNHILKILVIHGADEDPVDVSILVEGHEILPGGNNTAKACSLLMGLIYALNLAYPPTLRNTSKNSCWSSMDLNCPQ
ncbi:hypothetical protein E3U43_001439, partial [Larimichthys crocea]